ncbi:cytochrome c oxidase subunit II [Alteromonas oceanisediminis]|uniref:cytochrome c oxidase subunit II n=1 Tax=Alteromonas oceanisediminis TaxID=2836180 RepID=UPI001BDB25E1|nr:cytochrome c oxidase subunit II [Alteromonas oceanisediminis]MBT0586195.1 cytochrome c oxidase subunit II [Alteromonas oceanisediminis]
MLNRLDKLFILTIALSLAGCNGGYSILDPAGPNANAVRWLWWGMFSVGSLVLIGVCALWWYAMRKPHKDYSPYDVKRITNRLVLMGGIGLPVVCISVLLVFGIPAGHNMLPWPSERTITINVHAKQWLWEVSYPDHHIQLTDEIYLPASTPVNIEITSEDVIHSFWVPRLGGKMDAIPGRTNVLRLFGDKPGSYAGQCAEYCGLAHTKMKFVVHVLPENEFATWLSQQQRSTGEANQ